MEAQIIHVPAGSEPCANCGHPIKMKEETWRHTNLTDGHTFLTVNCQYCIAEGRACRSASPVSESPEPDPRPEVQRKDQPEYKICSICHIYARNQVALMKHYREKHPLDSSKLLLLKMQGKSIEEMATILERSPATIKYHLGKLDETEAKQSKFSDVEMVDPDRGADPAVDSRTRYLEAQNGELRAQIEALQSRIRALDTDQEGWVQTFHLESSGDGAQEGVSAVRNAIKATLPYFPDFISLEVKSNKELHKVRIFVEVSKK